MDSWGDDGIKNEATVSKICVPLYLRNFMKDASIQR